MSRIGYLTERYERHRMRNFMAKSHPSNIFNISGKDAMYTSCQNSERQAASYYSEQRKIDLLDIHRASTKSIAFTFHQKNILSNLVKLSLHHSKRFTRRSNKNLMKKKNRQRKRKNNPNLLYCHCEVGVEYNEQINSFNNDNALRNHKQTKNLNKRSLTLMIVRMCLLKRRNHINKDRKLFCLLLQQILKTTKQSHLNRHQNRCHNLDETHRERVEEHRIGL